MKEIGNVYTAVVHDKNGSFWERQCFVADSSEGAFKVAEEWLKLKYPKSEATIGEVGLLALRVFAKD